MYSEFVSMDKNKLRFLAIVLGVLIVVTGVAAFILAMGNRAPGEIRVACVGDSLTQSTVYPYKLSILLGNESYAVRNFGAGSTTILRDTETPYMNTTKFQEALDFQPDIVIIMLGTNDAQPNLRWENASLVGDHAVLVNAFQRLESKPEIWAVLPPPIFSNQSGKIDPEYFKLTVIPSIEEAANQTDVPTIDVFSALESYPQYFRDGLHPNREGAELIANTIYNAISQASNKPQ
jgi:alpha-L-fucosidase 2